MATRYSADDFAGMLGLTSSGLPIGTETLDTLLRQMGIANPYAQGGEAFSVNESGNRVANPYATLTPEALSALQGYDFNWQQGGPANSGTFSATGNGNTYSVNQKDETLGTSLANWAAMAAAGFGGAGLMGLGPLGAVLYRVELPNGKVILAHLSKELADAAATFAVGDELLLELTPFDFDQARILAGGGA